MSSHRKNHAPVSVSAHPLALGGKGREVRIGSEGKIRGAALVIVLCFLVIITGLVAVSYTHLTLPTNREV